MVSALWRRQEKIDPTYALRNIPRVVVPKVTMNKLGLRKVGLERKSGVLRHFCAPDDPCSGGLGTKAAAATAAEHVEHLDFAHDGHVSQKEAARLPGASRFGKEKEGVERWRIASRPKLGAETWLAS